MQAAAGAPLLAAPQGILEIVQPSVPRLVNFLGTDLLKNFNPQPNASDPTRQDRFLPNGIFVRAVFFTPPTSDFNKSSLDLMGYNRTLPLNCASCRDPVSGRVFWGFVGAVVTGSPLLGPTDPLALQLVARGYVYTANFMLASGVIVDSAGSPQEPYNPVCSTADLQGGSVSQDLGWKCLVGWGQSKVCGCLAQSCTRHFPSTFCYQSSSDSRLRCLVSSRDYFLRCQPL